MPRIIIFSELSEGGIADYAHDQANALAARGLDVEMLCVPSISKRVDVAYKTWPILKELRAQAQSGARALRWIRLGLGILHNVGVLCEHLKRNPNCDVITHFSEYLAPLWAWRLRRLACDGVRFHTVLHDPVRNYRVGPRWWHELSVRQAFSVFDTVFVHTRGSVPVPVTNRVVWVPYGVHSFPAATSSREIVRRGLAIPVTANVLTAFGYIRDDKNLDLVLRAISDLKETYLVVAGKEQGGGNKSIEFYKDLAKMLGCGDRCRWLTRFLSPNETADLLCASDLSVLTYSRKFVSSSAALGVTINYRLPCLISSGSHTTEAIVRRYELGIWVEPDSVEAIRAGLQKWLREGVSPDWETYMNENSWARNAELVHQAILAAASQRAGTAH